jgi:hypothetical protein
VRGTQLRDWIWHGSNTEHRSVGVDVVIFTLLPLHIPRMGSHRDVISFAVANIPVLIARWSIAAFRELGSVHISMNSWLVTWVRRCSCDCET